MPAQCERVCGGPDTSKLKKEECNQRDLNISDQFVTLPCSTMYFLGIRARLLQKLSMGNSSIGKKSQGIQFLREEF